MPEFLTVAAVVVLVGAGLLVLTLWRLVRSIRRSRLLLAGRRLAGDGRFAVAACRPGPVPHRAAARRALRVSRAQRQLRERVTAALRVGADLGEVPSVLPRLEAEGERIRAGLGRLVGSVSDGRALLEEAERHLATVAELTEVVDAAAGVQAVDRTLGRDVEEAAMALRLRIAAHAELTAHDLRA
jgi:hypothetical protein